MDFKLISDPSVSTFLYLEVHEVPLFFVLTFAVQQLLDITQRFNIGVFLIVTTTYHNRSARISRCYYDLQPAIPSCLLNFAIVGAL